MERITIKDEFPTMNVHGTHLVSIDAPDGTPILALLKQGDVWKPHVYTEKEVGRIMRHKRKAAAGVLENDIAVATVEANGFGFTEQ